MKKFILIPVLLVLSGCAGNNFKTNEAPIHTSLIYQKAAIPKVNLTLPTETKSKHRHRSIIEIGKTYFHEQDNTIFGKKELASKSPKKSKELRRFVGYIRQGVASWYGPGFHGKKTATGEVFNMYKMTAAHKTLPIPSYAQITNLKNNKSVVVRINDRGPYAHHRLVDLSYAAAKKIGLQGTGKVEIKAIPTAQAIGEVPKT